MLNFSVSKLPSLPLSFVLHACTLHLSIVGCAHKCLGTWSITTIEVILRDGKFIYCRPHLFNPLTTDDTFWCCLTLAVCYQLVQSVLKIVFVLAKKKGGIGGGRQVSTQGGCLSWL